MTSYANETSTSYPTIDQATLLEIRSRGTELGVSEIVEARLSSDINFLEDYLLDPAVVAAAEQVFAECLLDDLRAYEGSTDVEDFPEDFQWIVLDYNLYGANKVIEVAKERVAA